MKTLTWKDYILAVPVVIVLMKSMMILNYVLNPSPTMEMIEVTNKLESIYDDEKDIFHILNKTNISFVLRPKEVCRGKDKVVMVLSAPKNIEKRRSLRAQFSGRKDIKLIFLLGIPADRGTQSDLETEHVSHEDIVQISVKDHYTILAYKTLSGFVWITKYCGGARLVVKVDDDVLLDWRMLVSALKTGRVESSLLCPGVLRNVKPYQHNTTQVETIMNKWSVNTDITLYPDYCFGWLYVTTPAVGLALAEVSVIQRKKLVMTNDDNFVTGILRSHLAGVNIQQLEGGLKGAAWDSFLSHCPFLGFTNNVFFNSFVLKKGSDGVDYVNGGRFYVCTLFQYFVYYLDSWSPRAATITTPFWQYCKRGKAQSKHREAVPVNIAQNKSLLIK